MAKKWGGYIWPPCLPSPLWHQPCIVLSQPSIFHRNCGMLLHRILCVCMQLCGVCRWYPTRDYVPQAYHHSKAHYSSSAYDTTHLCNTICATRAYITIYVAFWLTCDGNTSVVGNCMCTYNAYTFYHRQPSNMYQMSLQCSMSWLAY